MADILVVDDDENICAAFKQFLTEKGHAPLIASNAQDALSAVGEAHPDLVIMDVRMPGTDGLEALRMIREVDPDVSVLIMTAYGTSQTSIEAMRLGAFDYLTKPLDLDILASVIDRALDARSLGRKLDADASDHPHPDSTANLAGSSPQMEAVYKRIGLLSTNDVPVLLLGERGVGKSLVARTIHLNSLRKDHPFVTVYCADLPEADLVVELFGGGVSAGESASQAVRGKIETAQGGAVLIYDIDALPITLQAKLARFLAEGSFERPGGGPIIAADTRIFAASEENLANAVGAGTFSDQLLDRLGVFTVHLPPLRERKEDLGELVAHFIKRCSNELQKPLKGIDDRALQILSNHPWLGNVGELENVIKRAAVLTRGSVITPDVLEESLKGPTPRRRESESALHRAVRVALEERLNVETSSGELSPFHDVVGFVEEILIREALAITSGNQLKAAELLGLNRATLRKKLRSPRPKGH
jgi:DNA-binding NtrC family response regulator